MMSLEEENQLVIDAIERTDNTPIKLTEGLFIVIDRGFIYSTDKLQEHEKALHRSLKLHG